MVCSSAVMASILKLVVVANISLNSKATLVAQNIKPDMPTTIAPIKAPFDMPQLKRPSFPDRTFDIRDYEAVQCKWEDDEKHKSTEAIHKAIIACYENGGGKVLIPEGEWLTGAIILKAM